MQIAAEWDSVQIIQLQHIICLLCQNLDLLCPAWQLLEYYVNRNNNQTQTQSLQVFSERSLSDNKILII